MGGNNSRPEEPSEKTDDGGYSRRDMAELLLFRNDSFRLFCAFGFIFMLTRAAARHRAASWAESLARTFLTVFGGGTLVPLILNLTPVYLANDLVFAMTLLSWVLTHRTPVGRLVEDYQVLRMPLNLGANIFRAHGIFANVKLAMGAITASAYYPTPIFGPIVLGTLGATGGMFLPFDKGLSALGTGMSLGFEIPCAATTFFHFMVNDEEGTIGQHLRQVTGNLTLDAIKLVIVFWFVAVYIMHEIHDPAFDPFAMTGFHSVFNTLVPARGYDLDSAPKFTSGTKTQSASTKTKKPKAA